MNMVEETFSLNLNIFTERSGAGDIYLFTDNVTALFGNHIYRLPCYFNHAILFQANNMAFLMINNNVAFITTLAGFVHWRLTGQKVIGVGDASGMFPIDIATGSFDAVHRVVGRPGIILVGEGSPHRVKPLLAQEKKKISRIVGDTPIYDFIVGNEEGETTLRKLAPSIMKLPRNIPADMIHYGVTKTALLGLSRGLAKRVDRKSVV